MKKFKATTQLGTTEFEVEDGKVFLITDDGTRFDTTWLALAGSTFTDPEEALIDLYTDNGNEPGVSIVEVTE